MKLLLFTLVFFNALATIGQMQNEGADSNFKKLNWLIGTWSLTNASTGVTGTEHWSKVSDSELQGTGITLKDSDTTNVEKIKMIKRGEDIFFVADVRSNIEPVYFKLTHITDTGFVCENPTHDFPKKNFL